MQGQTRQHARLLCLLGVKQLVVGVNKMDSDVAGYKEERYKEIKDEMKHMLTKARCPLSCCQSSSAACAGAVTALCPQVLWDSFGAAPYFGR